jgi:GxxExxY protein
MGGGFSKLIYPELSYKINGILYEVHNRYGRFLNEKQYGDAVEKLLSENNIKYEREKKLPKFFDGENERRNMVDFLIEDKILLELKDKRIINREDYYQVRRYLESLNLKLGILVNFRERYLKSRRILNSKA